MGVGGGGSSDVALNKMFTEREKRVINKYAKFNTEYPLLRSVSCLCFQTYPCQHNCVMEGFGGCTYSVRMSGEEIIKKYRLDTVDDMLVFGELCPPGEHTELFHLLCLLDDDDELINQSP